MIRRSLFLSCLLLVLLPHATALAGGFDLKSESQVQRPPYSEILKSYDRLQTRFPSRVTLIEYGRTPQDRPLILIRIQADAYKYSFFKRKVNRAILVTGATHGNEYLHIVDRLGEALLSLSPGSSVFEDYLSLGGALYLVPIFNPDGFDNGVRENSAGKDLNRDFDIIPENDQRFSQPETRLFAHTLEQELKQQGLQLGLSLDYHCCMRGTLLYPWGYKNETLPDFDLKQHLLIGSFFKKAFGPSARVHRSSEILYLAPGASDDYHYAKHGAIAFTYEGSRKIEKDKLTQHIDFLSSAILHLSR